MDMLSSLINNGLEHIAEDIIDLLDNQSIAKCCQVSKTWNFHLKRTWLIRQIDHWKAKYVRYYRIRITPEMDKSLNHFKISASIEDLEEVIKIMKTPGGPKYQYIGYGLHLMLLGPS